MNNLNAELQLLSDAYKNAYLKASTTPQGMSFLPEDKRVIGEQLYALCGRDFDYQPLKRIAEFVACEAGTHETDTRIFNRFNQWRGVVTSKKFMEKKASSKKVVVDAKPVISSLEDEFDRQVESDRREAYLKFLHAQHFVAKTRLNDIECEINKLT